MFPKHLTVHLVVCEISKYPQDAPTPVISVKYPTVRRGLFFIGPSHLVWQMATTTFSLQDDSSTPVLMNRRGRERAQHLCTTH